MENSDILIIGVGNKLRGDDAAGLLVIKKIKESAPEGAELTENNGDGVKLINMWAGRKKVILIDAVSSGSLPGTIHKFAAPGSILPSELFKFSSHLFSVPQAIELASTMGNLPQELIIYGIEAASFNYGSPVSPEVEIAINTIAEQLLKYIELSSVVDV